MGGTGKVSKRDAKMMYFGQGGDSKGVDVLELAKARIVDEQTGGKRRAWAWA